MSIIENHYARIIPKRGETPKLMEGKSEDDYYCAHGGFLLKEKAGRSWATRQCLTKVNSDRRGK